MAIFSISYTVNNRLFIKFMYLAESLRYSNLLATSSVKFIFEIAGRQKNLKISLNTFSLPASSNLVTYFHLQLWLVTYQFIE